MLFVDADGVDDVAGFACVTECVHRFVEMLEERRDAGKHGGFGVAAEGIFQELCEDGVSIRNEWFALSALVDNLTKSKKRLVDVTTLDTLLT